MVWFPMILQALCTQMKVLSSIIQPLAIWGHQIQVTCERIRAWHADQANGNHKPRDIQLRRCMWKDADSNL